LINDIHFNYRAIQAQIEYINAPYDNFSSYIRALWYRSNGVSTENNRKMMPDLSGVFKKRMYAFNTLLDHNENYYIISEKYK